MISVQNLKQNIDKISESDSLDSEVQSEMEPYVVRRLSFHALQLPPLSFRLAEQYDWEKKSETEHIPRPTTLPLKTLPLIAITSADNLRKLCADVHLTHENDVPSHGPC
ncbi:hypothetical protein chiPu_0005571 [Chiloscyllium punctatum]|uniref:Uncharacterized protein n=1 Tax=Chiloscyllium punctatum TaxID=137246 RepID=A0A401S9S1_CHIPU|nr:hypothetical protein [Chiloscyllium punctatum]